MRRAFLASADLTDIQTAMALAYEQTGRVVDRLRAHKDTVNDIVQATRGKHMYAVPGTGVLLFGVPVEMSDEMPHGVVEVTWRKS